MKIRGYSSPFNVGHKALEAFWKEEIIVQEKIDGSQISFGVFDGKLKARSRNAELIIDAEDKSMFKLGIQTIIELKDKLNDGWTYRGEYLAKSKQNTLAYDRVPKKNIILFDIDKGNQDYCTPGEMGTEAIRLGLESVPCLGLISAKPAAETLKKLLHNKSILGNVDVEGIVLKNYYQFGRDKKVLMAKYVSEQFTERHSADWKKRHPSSKDIIQKMGEEYGTHARWMKAVQHKRETGEIQNAPQDIPILLREINEDILAECGEEIKERLFKDAWKKMSRVFTRGFPEWYKNLLLEESLDE